ncbi:recombinase family protein [Streptomyces sp. NBC_01262]|uniref:recombinase family protein n=1 Tax=Streptomyces sp. NBC_01262 TaxID=2903803 RepID=UPI002E379BE5|nr:recombinase family protein [Streptomyces sp. NBC_01262]
MGTENQTLAFIYDRILTPTRGILELRLGLCREYAAEERWELAGEWVDEGDAALEDDNRPQFDALIIALVAATATGRTVVVLVADWDRFSRDAEASARLRYRVRLAGSWCQTVTGESDREAPSMEALRRLRLA